MHLRDSFPGESVPKVNPVLAEAGASKHPDTSASLDQSSDDSEVQPATSTGDTPAGPQMTRSGRIVKTPARFEDYAK